jgi:hypothetical protein
MYVTANELRAEGAVGTKIRIENAILLAQTYIEKETGRWFELKTVALELDGEGDKVLFLPHFCFSVTSILVDDSEVDADGYTLYNRFTPDDREIPKICFETNVRVGKRNVEINGRFGYVESDETTPVLIKKAVKKLALTEIEQLSDTSRRDLIDRGRVVEEKTDGHSYKLSDLAFSGGPTGDSEIDGIIMKYRKPLGMSAV